MTNVVKEREYLVFTSILFIIVVVLDITYYFQVFIYSPQLSNIISSIILLLLNLLLIQKLHYYHYKRRQRNEV